MALKKIKKEEKHEDALHPPGRLERVPHLSGQSRGSLGWGLPGGGLRSRPPTGLSPLHTAREREQGSPISALLADLSGGSFEAVHAGAAAFVSRHGKCSSRV